MQSHSLAERGSWRGPASLFGRGQLKLRAPLRASLSPGAEAEESLQGTSALSGLDLGAAGETGDAAPPGTPWQRGWRPPLRFPRLRDVTSPGVVRAPAGLRERADRPGDGRRRATSRDEAL